MHWYLIHSKPRQEDLVVLNLHRLGVESFCPHLKPKRLIRSRRPSVPVPLFPGYLFSMFDFPTQYRKVNYAQGVQRVVTFGSVPAIVEEEIIESIKAKVQNAYVILQPTPFIAGQLLRIEEGPLRGLEAIFEKELSGQQRIALLLRAVSYQARVIVDREHVAIL